MDKSEQRLLAATAEVATIEPSLCHDSLMRGVVGLVFPAKRGMTCRIFYRPPTTAAQHVRILVARNARVKRVQRDKLLRKTRV